MNAASMAAPGATALQEVLSSGNPSVVGLVDALLLRAAELGASDIHAEPAETAVRVRLRVDGLLEEVCRYPIGIHGEMVSRVKVLSGLRTDEHQAPQDGRFRTTLPGGASADLRVSIAPTFYGENFVLRLLADRAAKDTLDTLGFSPADREKIEEAIRKPSGMVLATGPTGSGKTTTLYALIKKLRAPAVSIVTVEDPIEYSIEDIAQIQVNARVGLTFASGLRSILRQDPDIIMVGEIRDAETAGIAVNTALTGHLLLSTLHTNDAATTLPRLVDMGIDPYLVASTMNIAIGQRLVRRVCEACSAPRPITAAEASALRSLSLSRPFEEGEEVREGKGCDACALSGYRGRISITEVLVADAPMREAILRKASAAELRALAVSRGMTTMLEDGAMKVRSGATSIAEVLRAVHD